MGLASVAEGQSVSGLLEPESDPVQKQPSKRPSPSFNQRIASFRNWLGHHPLRAVAIASLGLVIVPTLAAFTVSSLSSEVYEAHAEVLITDTTDSSASEQLIATQVTLLTSRSVLGPVAEAHGMPTSELASSTSAERVNSSQVIGLTVRGEDRDEAVRLTGEILDHYLTTAKGAAEVPADIQYLQSRIDELTSSLNVLDQQGDGTADPDLDSERELLIAQITNLQDQLTNAEIGNLRAAPPAKIVTAPYAASDPVSPKPGRAAAGGALAGILCAGILIALFVRWNRHRSA
jgi:capsular polysaccharide biosynthesis protein